MNDLTTTSTRSPTLFCVATLNEVARWTADIDGETFYMPPDIPAESGPALRQAAVEHRQALTPATPKQITRILMVMRSSTHRRNETTDEAEASFRALVQSLKDTPLDIVEQACQRYIRTERFFPRAPAELLAFSEPLLTLRRRRAINLERLGLGADEKRKRNEELERPCHITLDDLRELAANPLVSNSIFATYVERGWTTQCAVDQALAECMPEPEAK